MPQQPLPEAQPQLLRRLALPVSRASYHWMHLHHEQEIVAGPRKGAIRLLVRLLLGHLPREFHLGQ